MTSRIYLDHNATTSLDPRVLQAVIDELNAEVGNPSSIHFHGQKARQKLDHCRQIIARFLHVKSNEIIFNSGGTESANTLLNSFLQKDLKGHIITSNVEHSCVYHPLKEAEKKGSNITFLPVGQWGAVQPQALREAIKPSTQLIVLLAANNETGVKTDLEAIAKIAEEFHIPLVIDGVALLGKERFLIPPGVSAMFFSGHKFHAPKGTGFIFCRQSFKWSPLLLGGSQEFNRRAGTENLPGIAGLATAVHLLNEEQERASERMKYLRDYLEEGLKKQLKDIVVNGEGPRVVNTTNISFLGVDGESLLMSLDMEGISISHGSACASGAIEPSRILHQMGTPLIQARSAIRFSLSRFTTQEEIERSIEIITKVVNQLRNFKSQKK